MTLYEELYFDITIAGKKSSIKRFMTYLRSGELDDFFEFQPDYIIPCEEFEESSPDREVFITFTNDDYAIEIDEFDVDDFLDLFCRAAKDFAVDGRISDNDDSFDFYSEPGSTYFLNARRRDFNEDDDLREADNIN